MNERAMDALNKARDYFVAVIEMEADGHVVPSRTEELHWAVEGLEGIAVTKYKQFLKSHVGPAGKAGLAPHDAAITAMSSSPGRPR